MKGIAILATMLATAPALGLDHDPDPKAMEDAFAAIADTAMDSTVALRTYQVISEGPPRVMKSLSHGSGTIVSAGGEILTNAHVIEGANRVMAILRDGTFLEAEIVKVDDRGDLALLKVDADRELTAMPLAEPGGLSAGKWAFAVGNPRGIARSSGRMSFTVGTVSGLGRDMTNRFKDREGRFYGNMIECDLSVWPGSSGGPLLDSDGKLAGVVTAMMLPGEGQPSVTAFAIPMEGHALRALRAMLAGRDVQYGFIGVELSELDIRAKSDLGLPLSLKGALVTRVMEGLPAEAAGVVPGDVIMSFGEARVESVSDLSRTVGEVSPGEIVAMVVVRDGKTVTLTVQPTVR